MKRKRVSLDDIADSVGVSRSLVSLVLNGKSEKHGISEITRSRVLDKARELNYRPNHFARGLRLGKSFTIGLIVSDIANGFYSKIARNIEDLAEESGYHLITCSTDEDIEKELKLIRLLRNRQIDGLIISTSQPGPEEFERLNTEGFPVVLIDRYYKGVDIPSVVVDNLNGAMLATRHLLDSGFKRPLALAITPTHISTVNERLNGYKAALNEQAIEPWIEEIPFRDLSGYVDNLIGSLAASHKLPDSIFTLNNNLATAALQALRNHNISIPGQVGLISFDDVPYFGFMSPTISAVSQPLPELCSKAFELLLDQINGKEAQLDTSMVFLQVELMARESTRLTIPV
jgi:LacI family transcriptional regulator